MISHSKILDVYYLDFLDCFTVFLYLVSPHWGVMGSIHDKTQLLVLRHCSTCGRSPRPEAFDELSNRWTRSGRQLVARDAESDVRKRGTNAYKRRFVVLGAPENGDPSKNVVYYTWVGAAAKNESILEDRVPYSQEA